MTSHISLQDRYAPRNICFGCGPANARGLQVKSFPQGDEVVADWQPQAHHEAFHGHLNGGIIGTLLDCHCNWTGVWHLMQTYGYEDVPCTVTAQYTVKMLHPTPTAHPLRLVGRVTDSSPRRVNVTGELVAGGPICATFEGVFVVVRPGHPAFHRW